MAISTFENYRTKVNSPRERVRFTKAAPATGIIARPFALWANGGFPAVGSAPSTAVVPDRTTTGALGQANGTNLSILNFIAGWVSPIGGTIVVADRLSHQGGLNGTVTGAQVTNLPTAALTRHTNGEGVNPSLEIYSVIGGTATTGTVSYTNTASTAGQVTPAAVVGGTGLREAGQVLWMSLAPGDTGALSAESVSLVASTVGAGNFGVTLRYPVLTVPASRWNQELFERGRDPFFGWGHFQTWENDACSELIQHTSIAAPGVLIGELHFGEL